MKIIKTEQFNSWFNKLRDKNARARIILRIDRATLGNLGDVKSVGSSVSEMRIDCGKGYRIYYTQSGKEIILLLIGGNKSTQSLDIKKAKEMATEYHAQRGERND